MVIFMFFKLINKLFNNKHSLRLFLVVYIVNCDIALGQIESRLQPVDRGVGTNISLN